jgi:hypothetical protein
MVGKSRRYGGNVVNGRGCLANWVMIWAVISIILSAKSAQAGSTESSEPIEPVEPIGLASIYRLYPDIGQEQSDLAHIGLQKGYSGDFTGALKLYAKMEKLETRDSLAPLSQLLIVATGVLMLERSDFRDEDELARITKTVEDASEQGHYLCRKALEANKNHPTYMLILGGIQGFLATRKIHTQPTRALQDGFHALRLLEKTIKIDPRIKDAFMGQGIFDCTASNAPLVVRGALKLLGRSSNFNQGLRALRVSAYSGQYTSVASQLFLIQFLSPYEDESVAEKQDIFVGLKTAFPTNPMYDFLANDEALCFYPDSFYAWHAAKSPTQIEKSLRKLRPHGYAGARYLQLVKAQLSLLQDEGNLSAAFDTTFEWREYAYYPIFLEGLRRKREFEDSVPRRDPSIDPDELITAYRDSALTLLRQSAMTPTAKRYHAWRVRDAMKLKRKAASAIAAPSP